jgi:hypothetical protein
MKEYLVFLDPKPKWSDVYATHFVAIQAKSIAVAKALASPHLGEFTTSKYYNKTLRVVELEFGRVYKA